MPFVAYTDSMIKKSKVFGQASVRWESSSLMDGGTEAISRFDWPQNVLRDVYKREPSTAASGNEILTS